jgi:Family of unknown function (DUF6325)
MGWCPATRPPATIRVVDLVEYFVVVFPDRAGLASVEPALVDLVQSERIRILDVVALVRADDGGLEVVEASEDGTLASIAALGGDVGLMSEHDLQLAAEAVRPGEAGLVIVAEDRWAAQLSAAARRAGGQIVAGERVPRRRVEAALAEPPDEQEG